jgi:sugar phosphate isomerase/epimerase
VLSLAADVGARVAVYGSPFSRNVVEGLTYPRARDLMKEGFLAVLDQAKALDVALCIEPLPPDCTDLFTTVESAFGFIREVNHSHLGLMVDTKAMSTEARPVPQTLKLFAPFARHVHANDASGRAPGFGNLDFQAILKALTDSGYQGYVSLEPFQYLPDPETVVATSLKYLKGVMA